MNTHILQKNSDNLGVISSTICAIHCMATPFLFIAKSCTASCCTEAPLWWKAIDILFLVISFTAIYFSVKNSSNSYVKFSLWFSWLFLVLLITNEHINIFQHIKWLIYIPAFSLVFLHIYNRKYCQCKAGCCSNH